MKKKLVSGLLAGLMVMSAAPCMNIIPEISAVGEDLTPVVERLRAMLAELETGDFKDIWKTVTPRELVMWGEFTGKEKSRWLHIIDDLVLEGELAKVGCWLARTLEQIKLLYDNKWIDHHLYRQRLMDTYRMICPFMDPNFRSEFRRLSED